MSTVAHVLDAAVVVSAVAALAVTPRALRREVRPGRGGVPGPEALLAIVVALILVNQLAFAVYVQRVHGGSTEFIARYLPPGWFDVPRDNPVVDWFAAHTPAPGLLAPSVLRVQAFLELPLVLLSFAAVLRRLDRVLYVRVACSPLLPLAAASYTVAFCAVEWDLRNPYTVDDIVIRVLSAVVTPPLLAWIAGREPDTTPYAPRPLVFAVDLWAYGHLMLTLYDSVLLYNLARLGPGLESTLTVPAVLVATTFASRYEELPGPRVTALSHTLGRGLALFLVPALAIRYAGSFGTPWVAAAAGAVVLLAAVAGHAVRLALPAVAGAGAGALAVLWFPAPYYEAALLPAAVVGLLAATATCAALDATRQPLDALP
ncbi:hypothetical protein [Streptomyces sp. CB01881]|uniref:hypothetical protein n=1 Tax=Streptomyces sp. CB01881 TaxID=2078691 RepID=UPI000CDC8D2D|nr:hypothetical protein [Streptomyces sp. CB01881]AUY51846.1 hypothetical protein C2142_26310 [Streptomyces sp. CB01881]TYC71274.1 hypothetical protein EH183_26290 [Streptomyces sp. CB01881]